VVVVVYNMAREAPRTLHSLSAAYQRHIDPDDYEVIVVDNGSNPPLDPQLVAALEGNFRLIRIDHASPSPAQAVNRGLAEARGEIIGVMIDGARIATPGLLHFARHGASLYDRAVVAALGWYLGFDFQRWSMLYGYDQAREDALLATIGWPQDGYRLFEIATMDDSCFDGWLMPITETNALFMRRALWEMLGGMDESFDAPGGGLINLDLFRRAGESPDAALIILLGEGTFHQFHNGTATNSPAEGFSDMLGRWGAQYEEIRGYLFAPPRLRNAPTYLGTLPRPALARFVRAAMDPMPVPRNVPWEPPLGPHFDRELWSFTPASRPDDPSIAALVDLAQNEFRAHRHESAAAVSRLVRERAPDEPEPQRLLSLTGSWLPVGTPSERPAEYHLALAQAQTILGNKEAAAANYRAALTFDWNLAQAHIGLANLRMPGDDYLVWLERLYGSLAPETVIEIGVYQGASLALLRPPTVAIGIDPCPTVTSPLKTETHIFAETSDEFFAKHRLETLLAGRPLSVGFIDGLHLYEQALKDFVQLERYCGPRSVILFHDTVPLDEATQSRARDTQFHTGDVWKTVLCLKHYRPDLDVFTIATAWTGLTVVTGLDPASRVLSDSYDEAVTRFMDTSFSVVECVLESTLNIIPNDWETVEARLKARGVL
jgi:Glycosyl transferase family 2/Methyltransferase domain